MPMCLETKSPKNECRRFFSTIANFEKNKNRQTFWTCISKTTHPKVTASGNICACVKLLVDGIFVMAKSYTEALSREIFWHTYSTKDVYFSLETLTKLCSILMHVRMSI